MVAWGQWRLLLVEVQEWSLGSGEAAHHQVGTGPGQGNLVGLWNVSSDDGFTLSVQLEEDVSSGV